MLGLPMVSACDLLSPEAVDELVDPDGDGVAWPDDCDDANASRYPGAEEVCDNLDNDCDSHVDEDLSGWRGWFEDEDQDGFGDPERPIRECTLPETAVQNHGDCDDQDSDTHPGLLDNCDDVDTDCDGTVDEDAPFQAGWFVDADGDGYGDPGSPLRACDVDGAAPNDDDCDDTDPGVYPGALEQVELFWTVHSAEAADLIFLVDQSCSMDTYGGKLGAAFDGLVQELGGRGLDWLITVVNDDDGCNNSGLLTASVVDAQSIFGASVLAGGGSYTESLLTLSSLAAQRARTGECNEGIGREDAVAHFIAVSDESDQSASNWVTLVNSAVSALPNSTVRFSAITGPSPAGCGDAAYGAGYDEAATYTGGMTLSICTSDWNNLVDELAFVSTGIPQSYLLDPPPADGELEVYVNTYRMTSGWSYNADAQSIVFSNLLFLVDGYDIRVVYVAETGC